MSTSSIKCPECGGDKTIAEGSNKYICQYCGSTFVNASETITPATAAPPTVNCQYCGGEIVMGAQKCRHCGEWLNRPAYYTPVSPNLYMYKLVRSNTQHQKVRLWLHCLLFSLEVWAPMNSTLEEMVQG